MSFKPELRCVSLSTGARLKKIKLNNIFFFLFSQSSFLASCKMFSLVWYWEFKCWHYFHRWKASFTLYNARAYFVKEILNIEFPALKISWSEVWQTWLALGNVSGFDLQKKQYKFKQKNVWKTLCKNFKAYCSINGASFGFPKFTTLVYPNGFGNVVHFDIEHLT